MTFNVNQKSVEIELNYIWLGGKIPSGQLANLIENMINNSDIMTNLWVDSHKTYDIIKNDIKEYIARPIYKALFGQKKINWGNFRALTIGKDNLQIPDVLETVIETLKDRKLWASLSDIYRLLILTREDKSEKARHARFYVEADNLMLPNLWDKFANRDVAIICSDLEKDYAAGDMPLVFRTDLLYVDASSEKGKGFGKDLREQHIKTIFNDKVLEMLFKVVINKFDEHNGLDSNTLKATYGLLPIALVEMHFMTADPSDRYGMQDLLIDLKSLQASLLQTNTGNSWVDQTKEHLIDELFCYMFQIRLSELVDLSGLLVFANLELAIQHNKAPTKNNMFDLMDSLIKRSYGQNMPLPQWYLEYRRLIDPQLAVSILDSKRECSADCVKVKLKWSGI